MEKSVSSFNLEKKPLSDARPFFLIGPPRSGTTLMTRILNSHPRILLTNETAIFLQLDANIKKSRLGIKSGILYGKEYCDLWSKHLKENATYLIESYYCKIALEEKKNNLSYWGEKHPHLFVCFDFLSEIYPEAQFLYMIRDPRDTACSIAEMNRWKIREAINAWINIYNKYEDLCANQLDSSLLITVRYEDLIADYKGVSERILKDLGLSGHDKFFEFIDKYKDADAHRIKSTANRKINFMGKSLGRWKHEMSKQDKAFASEKLYESLVKYGYEKK